MKRLNPDEFANKVINQFCNEITDLVFQYIENDEELMLEYLRVVSDHNLDKTNQTLGFSIKQRFNAELKVLDEVYKKFEKTSVNDIVDLSHQEKAWDINKDTRTKEINYIYAFDLIH